MDITWPEIQRYISSILINYILACICDSSLHLFYISFSRRHGWYWICEYGDSWSYSLVFVEIKVELFKVV